MRLLPKERYWSDTDSIWKLSETLRPACKETSALLTWSICWEISIVEQEEKYYYSYGCDMPLRKRSPVVARRKYHLNRLYDASLRVDAVREPLCRIWKTILRCSEIPAFHLKRTVDCMWAERKYLEHIPQRQLDKLPEKHKEILELPKPWALPLMGHRTGVNEKCMMIWWRKYITDRHP